MGCAGFFRIIGLHSPDQRAPAEVSVPRVVLDSADAKVTLPFPLDGGARVTLRFLPATGGRQCLVGQSADILLMGAVKRSAGHGKRSSRLGRQPTPARRLDRKHGAPGGMLKARRRCYNGFASRPQKRARSGTMSKRRDRDHHAGPCAERAQDKYRWRQLGEEDALRSSDIGGRVAVLLVDDVIPTAKDGNAWWAPPSPRRRHPATPKRRCRMSRTLLWNGVASASCTATTALPVTKA